MISDVKKLLYKALVRELQCWSLVIMTEQACSKSIQFLRSEVKYDDVSSKSADIDIPTILQMYV